MKKRKLKKWVKVASFKTLLLFMVNVFIVKSFKVDIIDSLTELAFINFYAIGLTIDFNNIDL